MRPGFPIPFPARGSRPGRACGGTARGRTTITPAAVPVPRLGAVRESATIRLRGGQGSGESRPSLP